MTMAEIKGFYFIFAMFHDAVRNVLSMTEEIDAVVKHTVTRGFTESFAESNQSNRNRPNKRIWKRRATITRSPY